MSKEPSMSVFSELDGYLNRPFSSGSWSDSGTEHASQLMTRFTEADWAELSVSWPSRGKAWQQFSADVLSFGDSAHAVPILTAMIRSHDDELAIAAADSLRDFDLEIIKQALSPDIKKRLESLVETNPGIEAHVLKDLLASAS